MTRVYIIAWVSRLIKGRVYHGISSIVLFTAYHRAIIGLSSGYHRAIIGPSKLSLTNCCVRNTACFHSVIVTYVVIPYFSSYLDNHVPSVTVIMVVKEVGSHVKTGNLRLCLWPVLHWAGHRHDVVQVHDQHHHDDDAGCSLSLHHHNYCVIYILIYVLASSMSLHHHNYCIIYVLASSIFLHHLCSCIIYVLTSSMSLYRSSCTTYFI